LRKVKFLLRLESSPFLELRLEKSIWEEVSFYQNGFLAQKLLQYCRKPIRLATAKEFVCGSQALVVLGNP
jgi:hypothetical protein